MIDTIKPLNILIEYKLNNIYPNIFFGLIILYVKLRQSFVVIFKDKNKRLNFNYNAHQAHWKLNYEIKFLWYGIGC